MRNWNKPHEHNYGYHGGTEFIKSTFKFDNSNMIATRKIITEAFKPNTCFLLPPRGNSAQTENFNGQWSKLNVDFRNQLVIFIEDILSPSNLVIKKIKNKELNVEEFLEQVKNYASIMETRNKKIDFPDD